MFFRTIIITSVQRAPRSLGETGICAQAQGDECQHKGTRRGKFWVPLHSKVLRALQQAQVKLQPSEEDLEKEEGAAGAAGG